MSVKEWAEDAVRIEAAYVAAAKCEHVLQGVCLTCVGVSLAAAEERGRRRGLEEAIEMLELMRRYERVDSHVAVILGAIGNIRNIAPCSSVPCPEPPPGTLEAAEASARRGGQVGCGNIATYQPPRDSATSAQPTPKMQRASPEHRAAELRRASPRARVDEPDEPRDSGKEG